MSKSILCLRFSFLMRCCITLFHRFFSHAILVKGFFFEEGIHMLNMNFGDDLNIPIIEAVSGRKVKLWRNYLFNKRVENLVSIGSIIELYVNEYSFVWGTGSMYGNRLLPARPLKVCAVRGKLTQKQLIGQGINCPNIFGDPALLLPYIYKPCVKTRNKVGIIPHFHDYDLPHVTKFREEHPEILFIKMRGYTNWKTVIDQIFSCDVIYSSSLHGIIVSDAYCIPNVHVVFSNLIEGGNYKFLDYYSGVNRECVAPLDFSESIDILNYEKIITNYSPINYNPRKLIESFPFKLSSQFDEILRSLTN